MKLRFKNLFLRSISLIASISLLMGTIVVSMASYAVTTDDIDAYHAAINYTTPVSAIPTEYSCASVSATV